MVALLAESARYFVDRRLTEICACLLTIKLQVKCDEEPNHCGNCKRLGLECRFQRRTSDQGTGFRSKQSIHSIYTAYTSLCVESTGSLQRTTPTQMFTEAGTIRIRVQRACRNCRQRKVKCSGGTPQCDHCLKNRLDCEYPPIQRSRRKETPTRGMSASGRSDGIIDMTQDALLWQVLVLDQSLLKNSAQLTSDY